MRQDIELLEDNKGGYVKLFVLFYISLFCVSFLHYFFFIKNFFHPYDVFYGVGFFLSFLVCILEIKKEKFTKISFFDKHEALIFLSFIMLYCFTRWLKFDEMAIWNDEYTQFKNGVGLYPTKSIYFSYEQTQPPLDYFLVGFFTEVFGYKIFFLKLSALLATLSFYLTLPLTLSFFFKSKVTRWGPSFFLLCCNPLFAYSIEARPLMLALAFSLFYLSTSLSFIKSRASFWYLLVVQFLFLNTTGLQPQIFTFVTTVSLCFVCKKNKPLSLKLFLSSFINLILNIPPIYSMIFFADYTNQLKGPKKIQLDWSVIEKGLDNVLSLDSVLFTLPLILLVISLFIPGRIKRYRNFVFILFVGYISLYTSIFKYLIHYTLNIRYLFCFFTPFAFNLAGLIEEMRLSRFKMIFYSIAIALLGFGSVRNTVIDFKDSSMAIARPDWKQMYYFLKPHLKRGDSYAARVMLRVLGDSRRCRYVGKEFFLTESESERLLGFNKKNGLPYPACIYFREDIDLQKEAKFLFVVAYTIFDRDEDFGLLKPRNFVEAKYYGDVSIFQLAVESTVYETYRDYLLEVIENGMGREEFSPLYETLLMLELKYGKGLELFSQVLQEYKTLNLNEQTPVNGLPTPKEAYFQQRIEFFEKKKEERKKKL